MRLLLSGVVFVAVIQTATAQDIERITVGTLTCKSDVAEPLTEPVLRGISCRYEPVGSGPGAAYSGDIIHKSPDKPGTQLTGREVLVWNVWAPKGSEAQPNLLGKYFGVRKNDPSKPGTGVTNLVGGGGAGILLEQVVNPGTGATPNATTSVIELELRPART